MAPQDARLSKFEADFKPQQSEMTNKIDTFLKAINDRMTGALPSDTVKNPKLNVNPTSLVLSVRSYPMQDPQSLSHPFNSLPVLEVLAHAPMYNAILDKYEESLELGKNESTFIQGVMPKKMKDPGLFNLPCPRPPYYLEKDFMNNHLLGELEIARDAELNPFKDVLVFRNMVELLGVIPINLKGNMWESKDLIDKKIDWKRPPKEGDGAWHISIEIINPDGENFDRTFQSIPTTRKLYKKEKPCDIIDLEHFHDS
ncbi:hypothetical protein Tco_0484294 [Tanacetum coccineum]